MIEQGARAPAPLPLDGVTELEFEGRLLLIHPERQLLFVLNETARLVWTALQWGVPPEDIGDILAATFAIPHDKAQRDVDGMLAQWHEAERTGHHPPDVTARALPATPPLCRRIYALCGTPILIESGDRELEQAIHSLFAPAEAVGAEPRHAIRVWASGEGYQLAVDGGPAEPGGDLEGVVGRAINHVLDLSYPDLKWLAVFHAGAVAIDGRGVLMPGPSGSGKSTLTAGLVRAGCRYFSDDVVPLAAGGRIVPVPVGLCLKQGSWPVLGSALPAPSAAAGEPWGDPPRRYLDVTRFGRVAPADGLSIAAIVFPRYLPQAGLAVRELAPLAALERIIEARAWLSLDPPDLARLLDVLRAARAVQLTYGSLEDAVRFITKDLLA